MSRQENTDADDRFEGRFRSCAKTVSRHARDDGRRWGNHGSGQPPIDRRHRYAWVDGRFRAPALDPSVVCDPEDEPIRDWTDRLGAEDLAVWPRLRSARWSFRGVGSSGFSR
jgi:hypothetical protein